MAAAEAAGPVARVELHAELETDWQADYPRLQRYHPGTPLEAHVVGTQAAPLVSMGVKRDFDYF